MDATAKARLLAVEVLLAELFPLDASACQHGRSPVAAGATSSARDQGTGHLGTIEAAVRPAPRRSDAGKIRYTERDVTGLLLLAEHYAAPYDLLSAALDAPPARTRAVIARWRAAGLAASGSFGPGPAWCWLTTAGMTATGRGYPVRPPSLARLAHYRAVLAARLWLQAAPAYAEAQPWWN